MQSGIAKSGSEKLPPAGTVTPSGSSASDLQDSGIFCLFYFLLRKS